ncbi:MAG TPA: dihydroorotate dehydrogenase electron transfer subunit [Lachnospiraceae bacterium]|nr:dihydroorotate dehydrogenase electron transfer subunit [Lachnospiraceae bacterium]
MAQMRKVNAVVYQQTEKVSDIFDMWIESDLAKDAMPGQFINIYPKNESTLLPRPISICEIDQDNNRIRIVYRIAGKGTKEFSSYQAGDSIAIMGPIGNGFPIEKANANGIKKVLLMGGGIGIPPMLELAKQITCQKEIILGYRNQELFLDDDLERYGSVSIATEDGSVGIKGNVMNALKEKALEGDIIFACGPMPMLRAIKEYAKEKNILAFISLEERMACGVGACLGCVCKTKEKDHHSHVNNARVCVDGPVFEAREVDI